MNGDEIRDFCKRERMKKGKTRKELAMLVGMNPSTLARFEKGETSCNMDYVLRIIRTLGAEFKIIN